MSQVIKLETNKDPYEEIREDARKTLRDASSFLVGKKVTGLFVVVLNADGGADFLSSVGIDRQRKVGILMDLVHELCK